jgi:hypothetical protein
MKKKWTWPQSVLATAAVALLVTCSLLLADHKPNHNPGGGGGGEDPPTTDPPPDFSITLLGTLGGQPNDFSLSRGMNGSGDVVGTSISRSRVRAFLYTTQYGMEDLNRFFDPNSGRLQAPKDLVWGPGGNLYVTSGLTDEVFVYDGITGEPLGFEGDGVFVSAGSGGLDNPHGLTFGPDSHLYVTRKNTDEVLKYNGTDGTFMGAFVYDDPGTTEVDESGGMGAPYDLLFGPDLDGDTFKDLYISNKLTDEVLVYNGVSGAAIGPLFISNPVEFDHPAGMTIGPDGALYICYSLSNNVGRYDFGTDTFSEFASQGAGNLSSPRHLAFGPGPNFDLYITCAHQVSTVLRYNSVGVYQNEFITEQSGGLKVPIGLLFDAANNLLVTSRDTDQILVYQGPDAGVDAGAFIDGFVPEPD